MLGMIKSSSSWIWAACGKHPAARDFFRVGQEFPLLKIFSGWVDDGYNMLTQKNNNPLLISWRFWAKGAVRESLICGVVKDSSDGVGRNYPLLIIGTGHLPGWEEQWDLMPLAFEKIWREIEYITTQNFNDLKKLETEVKNIRQPQPGWQELKSKKDSFHDDAGVFPNIPDFPPEKKEHFIPLDQSPHYDQNLLISHWHSFFRKNVNIIPNAVFMGGGFGRSFVGFYKRPLTPMDFFQLWTAGSDIENSKISL
jgi:type VI secretion system protein VasJ